MTRPRHDEHASACVELAVKTPDRGPESPESSRTCAAARAANCGASFAEGFIGRRGHRCVPIRRAEVYLSLVSKTKIRRTNINLDAELVDAAAAVLGTARTTDTVHAALRAVIDRAARERLAQRDFADLTPNTLEQLRRPRQLAK